MAKAFQEAERLRIKKQNQILWMQGLYVYEAICDVSPVLHAFAKKGTKPLKYRTEPYPISGEKSKTQEDRVIKNEQLKAQLFFKGWAKATAKKFKGGGNNGG